MHANPQRLPRREPVVLPSLHPVPQGTTLGQQTMRFFRLFRTAVWRAFQHDAFAIAKASAYSSILSFFPALLILGSILSSIHRGEVYMREISYALSRILPAGANAALGYLHGAAKHPAGLLTTTSAFTLWTASGVMISWMEGFRRCYQLPKTWGLAKERLIAFSLVVLAGIPMTFATLLVVLGSRIETRILVLIGKEFSPYILLMWGAIRWLIATLTSIAVLALIYHNAVPRTQPWHSVIPGATLATAMWFAATALFGWYIAHYVDYGLLYGSLGVAVALLVWMYMVSLVVLIGAEFNALLFPRAFLGKELSEMHAPKMLEGQHSYGPDRA